MGAVHSHSAFGFDYNEHKKNHNQIMSALKKSGFGFSSKDSSTYVADAILKSEKINQECKQGLDEICYLPANDEARQYEPGNRHLWNPIRHYSGPYSVNLDDLDSMEQRLESAVQAAERSFKTLNTQNRKAPRRHSDMPPPQGIKRISFGTGSSSEGGGQGRGLGNTKTAHMKRLIDMGIITAPSYGKLTGHQVSKHYTNLRNTLEALGMGYHGGHANSFGSSYLHDIAKRKAFIQANCTTGVIDPNIELCQYPLFTGDRVSHVQPSQGEGSPAMFDLRLLEKRHSQIAEWIEKSGNEVDVTDQMVMRPQYYSLNGEKMNLSQRGTSTTNYLQMPDNLKVKAGRSRDEGYDMRRNFQSPDYFSQLSRASAPPASSVRQFQDLTLAEQIKLRDERISDSRERRQSLRGDMTELLQKAPSFGYSGSNTKGTMINRLQARKNLIKNNCPSGRAGFDQPCSYPLYRTGDELKTSDWSYPESDNRYPMHIKP